MFDYLLYTLVIQSVAIGLLLLFLALNLKDLIDLKVFSESDTDFEFCVFPRSHVQRSTFYAAKYLECEYVILYVSRFWWKIAPCSSLLT